jgi:hypothetical protein
MRGREDRAKEKKHRKVVLQGQEKVLQGQEDLVLQDFKHYDGENMKKDEDGGLNEKLNQDNAVIELDMNHCSRQPRCTRSWVFMPCEHLKLTGLLGYRRAPPLHLMKAREQQEYHCKCKIRSTRRE